MISRFLRIIALFLSALALQLISGCASPGEEPRGLSPGAGPKTDVTGPAIWKVADKDTTIYLFGTIHALPSDVVWLSPQIKQVLDVSDELVTEVDLRETDDLPDTVLNKAFLPENQTLRGMLSDEDRKEFEQAMVTLGLPIETFDRYEPWYAAMTFSLIPLLNAGYETDSGVETVLAENFRKDKPRNQLETVEFQIDLFDSLPMETQLSYLDEVVTSVPELTKELDAMVAVWLRGDADALAKLMNAQESNPVIYKRLITDRNKTWAEWIEHRLEQPGTVFIAVGAGHLAGKGSLQDQLKRRGIKSNRLR